MRELEGDAVVTMASLAQPLAALHDAIDRVQACAGEVGADLAAGDRELLVMAAQDVMRALVQTRRRCHELEQQVAQDAARALDLVARVLGGSLS